MSARPIFHALFRFKRLALLVFAATLAAGALLAARPPAWRAEAMLLPGTETPASAQALAALFRSRELAVDVVAAQGERLWPELSDDRRLAAFDAALRVRSDGALVRVSFDHPRPDLATRALASLVDGVRGRNAAVFSGGQASDEARRRLDEFRKAHGMFDAASERETLLTRRSRLQSDRDAALSEARTRAESLALLRGRLAATPATVELSSESGPSAVVDQARAKVFDLQTKEQELLGKYQDGSPFVRRVRDERRKAEDLLAGLLKSQDKRVVQGVNPVHQQIQEQILGAETAQAAAEARAKAVAGQVSEIESRLENLSALERQLAPLEAAAAEGEHGRERAVDGIGVVQGAAAPPRRLGPSPRDALLGAAGLGALLALAATLLAQRLSSRFSTPAEVERRLGLPVLATFPRES